MTSPDTLCRRFARALVTSDTDRDAIEKARLCLLDFLACALSTGQFSWVQQARQVATANSAGTHHAPIIGTPDQVCVQDAAFANAVAGHSLVRDDMHLGSVSHLGVVVVPVALALATREAVSGKRLLEAIVCGYEAGARLGNMLMDVETARKFRPTGLIGAFAAAATAARLCGLDETRTAHALGFAANYITGLNEWAAWGSDDMYFHPGIAARNGIAAMQLARAGANSAAGALDGQAGLFAALSKAVPESPSLPFASKPEILAVFFKQVPACNYAQTAAQVARKVRQDNALDPAAVETVDVAVPYAAAHYPGCDYAGPFDSILQARMSIHFNVASALLHGDFSDAHYRHFSNADTTALAAKTRVHVDDDLSAAYPAQQGAAITVGLTDDTTLEARLDNLLAASRDDVIQRFQEAASPVLGEATAALLEAIQDLENRPDTTCLAALSLPA